MSRGRGLILGLLVLGIVAVMLVFRVRVLVAGGKAALSILLLLAVAWALWPRRAD